MTSAGSPPRAAELARDDQGNAISGASVLVDARDNLVINQAEDGGSSPWSDSAAR